MKFGVIQFPGSCDEVDALGAARRVGDAELLWHGERDLKGADAIVVPGGFSYGDYLRAGAIARFAPVMESVIDFANDGGHRAGDLQRLSGAVRGAPAAGSAAREREPALHLQAGRAGGAEQRRLVHPGMRAGRALSIPAKHSWGRYHADEETLAAMDRAGQIVLRYADGENFNGSVHDIAGVSNERGNVFGLMPHPEHAVDELMGGSADGSEDLRVDAHDGRGRACLRIPALRWPDPQPHRES